MGHGGDGGDEPPHPFGGGFGDHQNDVVLPKRRGMTRWNATIDRFLTEKHRKRSAGNKEFRKKQVVNNRGGTCSYGSACFKKNLNRLEVFHRTHVNKRGEFVDPLVEEQYDALVAESQSQASQPTQDVDVNVFLQNSAFVTAIGDIIRPFKNQVNEENNDEEDSGEDEDN
ncbi:unnamed protein product [Lactuca saligna]|uniref:Uncharacterized protein n=1 Tax=Lactuca saligna TaxID=75948 RepID=A0AA35VDH5_LACSI|nr:unnamed protein product [Lactuca saligna]